MPKARRLALLFDLDGTLVDSIELIINSFEHAFASHTGPAPSREEFATGIGRPLAAQFAAYCESADQVQLLISKYREYQLVHHDRLTKPYEGMAEAVVALSVAGHSLGVVTSKIEALALRALKHVRFAEHFRVVVGCDATTRHKPDPEPVLLALERLKMSPENAIFVGDSPYDMQAGRAAGVTAVGVIWGAFTREVLEDAGAQHVLERPSELPGLVERISTLAVVDSPPDSNLLAGPSI